MKHIKHQLFPMILIVLVVIGAVFMPVGAMASESENILRISGAVSSITTSIPTRNEQYHPVTAMIDGIMTGDNRYKSENTLDRVDDLVITISLSETYNISRVKIFERWMEEYGSCTDEIAIAVGSEGNMTTVVADEALNNGTNTGEAVESVYDFSEAVAGDKIVITFKGGKAGRVASDSQYEIWEIEAFSEKMPAVIQGDILSTETVDSITTSIQSRNEQYHPNMAMVDGSMTGDAMYKSEAANGYDNTTDVPGVSKPLTITVKLKDSYELSSLKIYERYMASFESNTISSVKVGFATDMTTVAENVTLNTGADGETVATTINFAEAVVGDIIEINFAGGLPQRGDGGESQYQIWELEAYSTVQTDGSEGDEPGNEGSGGDNPGDGGDGGDIVIPGTFQPVAGVGDPTVKVPAATGDGTVIYEKSDFTADIYNTSDIKQLDPMLYNERGSSAVSENGNTDSCFMFGKQGYFTLKNAFDAYVSENGNVIGNIHELVFDMKFESASVYLYPCGGSNNRDGAASLVISGTTLTNDDDGTVYGSLPSGKWYQIKYTYDVGNTMLYISINNAVVYQEKSTIILKNFYSILYQQGDGTKFYVDNIKYSVKGNLEITDVIADDYKVEAKMSDNILTNVNGEDIDFKELIELYCGGSEVELKSVAYDSENKRFVLNTKTPVFSGMPCTIKMDKAIKSTEGVNIRNNYFYDFQTPLAAFDVSDVTKSADKIKATVVNTLGEEKTIVMAVIGKAADGTITSVGSTAKGGAEDGTILEYTLTDTNAVTYEVFFIEGWESCVPVKGAIYKLS